MVGDLELEGRVGLPTGQPCVDRAAAYGVKLQAVQSLGIFLFCGPAIRIKRFGANVSARSLVGFGWIYCRLD